MIARIVVGHELGRGAVGDVVAIVRGARDGGVPGALVEALGGVVNDIELGESVERELPVVDSEGEAGSRCAGRESGGRFGNRPLVGGGLATLGAAAFASVVAGGSARATAVVSKACAATRPILGARCFMLAQASSLSAVS